MSSKKNKANGFYCFMQDHIESERRRGRNINMVTAQSECDAGWKALKPEEKAVFNQRAKQLSKVSNEKYTSTGKPLSVIEAAIRQKEIEEKQLLSDVKTMIKKLIRGSTLEEHYFYLVHVNIFCVTTKNEFIPAEISILEFNLYEGLKETYHAIINPGPIPSGYAFTAVQNSKDGHVIPLPPYEQQDQRLADPKDCATVFTEVKRFLDKRVDENRRYPILFSHKNITKLVKGVLNRLAHCSYQEELQIRVADADRLLYELKNKSVEEGPDPDGGFPVLNSALTELERDVNSYKTGLACTYHELNDTNRDRYPSCSLSQVKCIFYAITDHCCHHLGIEMQPGRHCTTVSIAATPHASGWNTLRSDYSSAAIYGNTTPQFKESDNEDSDDGFVPITSKRGVGRGRGYFK